MWHLSTLARATSRWITRAAAAAAALLAATPSARADVLAFDAGSPLNGEFSFFARILWTHSGTPGSTVLIDDTGFWTLFLSATPVTDGSGARIGTSWEGSIQHTTPTSHGHPWFGTLVAGGPILVPDFLPLGTYSPPGIVVGHDTHQDIYSATLDWAGPGATSVVTIKAVHTPEPATGVLLAAGLGGLGIAAAVRRRREA